MNDLIIRPEDFRHAWPHAMAQMLARQEAIVHACAELMESAEALRTTMRATKPAYEELCHRINRSLEHAVSGQHGFMHRMVETSREFHRDNAREMERVMGSCWSAADAHLSALVENEFSRLTHSANELKALSESLRQESKQIHEERRLLHQERVSLNQHHHKLSAASVWTRLRWIFTGVPAAPRAQPKAQPTQQRVAVQPFP
jgi:hypothetical protein